MAILPVHIGYDPKNIPVIRDLRTMKSLLIAGSNQELISGFLSSLFSELYTINRRDTPIIAVFGEKTVTLPDNCKSILIGESDLAAQLDNWCNIVLKDDAESLERFIWNLTEPIHKYRDLHTRQPRKRVIIVIPEIAFLLGLPLYAVERFFSKISGSGPTVGIYLVAATIFPKKIPDYVYWSMEFSFVLDAAAYSCVPGLGEWVNPPEENEVLIIPRKKGESVLRLSRKS